MNQSLCFAACLLTGLLSVAASPLSAATYYVDFDAGDDTKAGTAQDSAWKRAPGDPLAAGKASETKLAPGDVVQFKAGVIYRGNIVVPASGEKGKPITYLGKGWGQGRAILDGSELITGWKKCQSPEDAGGAKNFENLYYTVVEAKSPFLLNLHETDTKTQSDEFLYIAQDPNPVDPFFNDRTDSMHKLTNENLTLTTVAAPEILKSDNAKHWNGASLLLWVNPNRTTRVAVTGFDPKTSTVTFEPKLADNAIYADKRVQYFAVYNSPHVLDQPGEYAITEPNADGKRHIVLWPRSGETINTRISRSVRETGFALGKESHITIEGFDIRKYAGEMMTDGSGIATGRRGVGPKSGYIIRDNHISHTQAGDNGYGGIYLDDTSDAVIENNDVRWTKNHRAIFITSGDNIIIRNNNVQNIGRTAVVMYGGRNSQILNNRISHIYGTHANALTLYIASKNVLVANNVITDASNPITFQDSGPLYFVNNVTDGLGKHKNINEWPNTSRGPWATGEIVFLNNTCVNAGANTSLSLGKDPEKKYVVVNNILDGLSAGKSKDVLHTHNLYVGRASSQADRYGWKDGDAESDIEDANTLFVALDKFDYTLKPASPASGKAADVTQYFPKAAFPDVDFAKLIPTADGKPSIGATPAGPAK